MINMILAFGLALAIDLVYTLWNRSVANDQAWRASAYSWLCPYVGSLALVVFLDEKWTVHAAALGHASGTLLAMRGRKWTQRLKALRNSTKRTSGS